jgi:hypothetical protein
VVDVLKILTEFVITLSEEHWIVRVSRKEEEVAQSTASKNLKAKCLAEEKQLSGLSCPILYTGVLS